MKTSKTSTITQQACEWVAKLNEADLSVDERNELQAWMSNSIVHRTEIKRVAQRWDDLNDLTMLAVPIDPSKPESSHDSRFLRLTKLQLGFATLAATILFATVTLTMSVWSPALIEQDVAQDLLSYSTELGEQKLVILPDSSTVLLNTNSHLSVTYTSDYRDIYLIEGEAHFEVQSSSERPFRVFAGKSMVRAVGTAFSVYLKKKTVDITVTHGSVEIDSIRAPIADAPRVVTAEKPLTRSIVEAGHAAEFNQLIGSIETKALSDELTVPAWHQGKLKFTGEPLTQVVEEISRYSPLSIVILDSDLRDLRIGGVFDAGETDKMLEALEIGFGIEVEYINERLVHLKAARIDKRQL